MHLAPPITGMYFRYSSFVKLVEPSILKEELVNGYKNFNTRMCIDKTTCSPQHP